MLTKAAILELSLLSFAWGKPKSTRGGTKRSTGSEPHGGSPGGHELPDSTQAQTATAEHGQVYRQAWGHCRTLEVIAQQEADSVRGCGGSTLWLGRPVVLG